MMRPRPVRCDRPRRRASIVRLTALAAIAVAPAPAAAAGVRDGGRAWRDIVGTTRAAAAPGTPVILVLRPAPAALRAGAVGSATATRAARRAQDATLRALAGRGFHLRVGARFVKTVDAVVAALPAAERARLAADPAVLGVYRLRQIVPSGIAESTLAGLGAAVRPVTAATGPGAGVTVAVLDGPIDGSHPYLAGRVEGPAQTAPPGGAAAGPFDHGTAMAGIVAGANGPAGLQGVAPGARILPVPVLRAAADGTLHGTGADLLAGFEQAADPNGDDDLADHARVVLAAVGAPFAGFADGAEERAVTALSRLGTVVVAAAGNDGPTGERFGTTAAPAAAADALAVGATDGRVALPQVSLSIGGAVFAELPAVPLAGALAPPISTPLAVHAAAARARPLATAGTEAADYADAAGHSLVAGAAALVPRDGGDLAAKARAAAAAGARALIVYGPDGLPAGALGVDDRVPIAVVGLDESSGLQVARAVAAGHEVSLSFGSASYAPNPGWGAVAPFSSTGLGYGDRLKPDLVMPGVAIESALPGGRYAALSGTSVAAAQAAGLVASLAAVHPEWSSATLRSALVGTASLAAAATGGIAPVEAQGGGVPVVEAAAAAPLVAAPSTLSFGRLGAAGGAARALLTLTNATAVREDVSLGFQADGAASTGAARVAVSADHPRFVLEPHAIARLTLTLRVAGAPAASGVAGGWLDATVADGATVHVPLAVGLAGAAAAPIHAARLSRSTLPALVPGARAAAATLSLVLGSVVPRADGAVGIVPVARFAIDLYHGRLRIARLYEERDVLPGRYRFGVTARGAGGRALRPGVYRLVLTARGADGGRSRVALRVRVRAA